MSSPARRHLRQLAFSHQVAHNVLRKKQASYFAGDGNCDAAGTFSCSGLHMEG
jgi:hypothetical protein